MQNIENLYQQILGETEASYDITARNDANQYFWRPSMVKANILFRHCWNPTFFNHADILGLPNELEGEVMALARKSGLGGAALLEPMPSR